MTDPITDMLNQIKNAQAVEKPEVLIPLSNIKYEIARILSERHFIGEIKKSVKGKHKIIKIALKYENGSPKISGLKRVSKPGQKIYEKSSEIKRVHGGFGISIISTSKGLMTNIEARKQKLGGEVICEVW
ncbi:MAG: 30S ribosomal protein S8 [Candidatus Staskawiczbacteria bacterium RIFOXYC1_FULL_37_43]|nr:MAG: 30S ribosomal protein S8 [Candidatus Staskawiczbacteria bacterium RIFCSPHIGHO2_01_FULL_37_17]OGZ72026.1 MAG: 30S ribosomal protein S8 [Candidatus Staskawiczbacteria bacterium RIFCSPLOWO2_01_FULL_37_19]OGZ75808.1 MAG: 30S ribosomal protein S8 [Candidatus Staskawiczbacteria bacterium RIFOXYA1_FULL_37_15]OGZ76769.1 MAG: 30S ribosomal protein S8 [Candidatus Staskawiczbacteria bacterium RIFOXYA12_FULL_37_10]OGZ80698.1 MAG: 30S ribosomal protein S8 [Candidatus Staskawiczbacteria bacterium RIF